MAHEALIRFGVFASVLVVMAVWESLAPRRERVASRARRSFNNLLLAALASLIVRTIPALSAVAGAMWASRNGFGLLNQFDVPGWLKGLVALIALDLLIYTQHVATHRLPLLWALHRVHHADLDLDATSGVRFHPLEILLSLSLKAVAVVLLGASEGAVLVFEISLNAGSVFNHANVNLPIWCDRSLRWLVVTPDMHRVHHSIRPEETHSNFGFNLPWWDWMFRTYRAQPVDPHANLQLGLPNLRTEAETVPLIVLLAMPFRSIAARRRDVQEPDPALQNPDL